MLHFRPLRMKNDRIYPWGLHFYDFGPSSFKDIPSKSWTLKNDIIDPCSYIFDKMTFLVLLIINFRKLRYIPLCMKNDYDLGPNLNASYF